MQSRKENTRLVHSRITVIPGEIIEIKGIDDSSRFLHGDDGGGYTAETICRFTNGRLEELGVMGEDVVDGSEVNVVTESGQGLEGGCSTNGIVVNLWDDLGQIGRNV